MSSKAPTAKLLLLSLALLAPAIARAVTFEVTQPCAAQAAVVRQVARAEFPVSIGKLSIDILEREEIPFIGTEAGLNSILNTPVGDGSLEVLSDTHMRAYGWCYEVDGKVPMDLIADYLLKGPEQVRWFYGFAEYKMGEWVSFCNPAPATTSKRYCR